MSSKDNEKAARTKNIKLPADTSTSQKSSVPSNPPKNPHHVETEMEVFLKDIEHNEYGPVLAKINQYVQKKLEEYVDFARTRKNSLQKLVEEGRAMDKKALDDWFDTVQENLKPKVIGWAHSLAESHLSSDNQDTLLLFNNDGDTGDSESAANFDFDSELDTFFRLELAEFHKNLDKRKATTYRQFSKYTAEDPKSYEGVKKGVEGGLLGIFRELGIFEENALKASTEDDKEKDGQENGQEIVAATKKRTGEA